MSRGFEQLVGATIVDVKDIDGVVHFVVQDGKTYSITYQSAPSPSVTDGWPFPVPVEPYWTNGVFKE